MRTPHRRSRTLKLLEQALAMSLSCQDHSGSVVRWVVAVTLAVDYILLVLLLSKLLLLLLWLSRLLLLWLNRLLLLWLNRLLLLARGTAGCQLPNGETTFGALASGMTSVNHLHFRSRRV
jgi:hypothetical protein